jgi:paraquat-inducible protein A
MSAQATLAYRPEPAPARLVECHECGRRYRLGAMADDRVAACRRCGAAIRVTSRDAFSKALALTLAGVVLLAIACTTPFMSLSVEGRVQEAALITGAVALAKQNLWSLAILIVLTTMLAPGMKLGITLYVLLALRLPRLPRHVVLLYGLIARVHPWAMIEIYLLGVFVAYVKLTDLAAIVIGPACVALGILTILMVELDLVLTPSLVWQAIERRMRLRPAAHRRLVMCERCSLLAPAGNGHGRCPRCSAALHARKPNSLSRTWALLIAAIVLYIPANAFPVMTVISFGRGQPDTILSGVKELFLHGMWPLALIVFFASIAVPVLKIVALSWLLVATQRKSRWRLRERTVLYRAIEFIGRWSMIDVFMISILVGLVQLGAVATIEPGVGVISFAAVVILTMFAAMAFDPRLMWDAAGENL